MLHQRDRCKNANYQPKPDLQSMKTFINKFSIKPNYALMAEDMPINLRPAHILGLKTLLIRTEYNWQKEKILCWWQGILIFQGDLQKNNMKQDKKTQSHVEYANNVTIVSINMDIDWVFWIRMHWYHLSTAKDKSIFKIDWKLKTVAKMRNLSEFYRWH